MNARTATPAMIRIMATEIIISSNVNPRLSFDVINCFGEEVLVERVPDFISGSNRELSGRQQTGLSFIHLS
jgi:hypothetical protein